MASIYAVGVRNIMAGGKLLPLSGGEVEIVLGGVIREEVKDSLTFHYTEKPIFSSISVEVVVLGDQLIGDLINGTEIDVIIQENNGKTYTQTKAIVTSDGTFNLADGKLKIKYISSVPIEEIKNI